MGFFGSGDKTVSTTSSQVGASDDGVAIGAGGAGAKEGGVSIATGVLSTNKFGTTEVIGGSNTTINQGFDSASVSSLLDKTTSSLGDLVRDQTESSLSAIAGLAETKQTDGENKKIEAGTWIAIVALLALAWVLGKVLGKK